MLDDPEFNQLGRQTWVLIMIIMTELLICIKFGWATITKPLPRHIALWWVLGALILIGYTFVKVRVFYESYSESIILFFSVLGISMAFKVIF